MALKSFPSLHSHSYFSVLDGVPSPKSYFERCEELGMEKIAFTEHGNMGSSAEGSIDSKEFKVQPILGLEAYVVDDIEDMKALRASSLDKDKEKLKKKYRGASHAVLLAKNEEGFENLIEINNDAWTKGFYYSPRCGFKEMFAHKKGIVCTSACMSGIIGKGLIVRKTKKNGEEIQFITSLSSKKKRALNVAKRMKKEFGDDFYIELQLLDMKIQDDLNEALIQIGETLDIPFVVTNDVHYVEKGGHKLQELIMRVGRGNFYESRENYLKSLKEWEKDVKEHGSIPKKIFHKAVDNCLKIADQCNYVVNTGNLYFPEFDHTSHFMYKTVKVADKTEFFKKMVISRARKILGKKLREKKYQRRLHREFKILVKLGGIDYFLICDDLLEHVRQNGAFSLIRGSANGSLIAFVLGFGLIDPIKHNIMFERFISEHRSLNDIDIDIDVRSEFRSKAIEYLRNKYGRDRVISVGTYNRMQLKGAIKDITRVFKDIYGERISKISPNSAKGEEKIRKLQEKQKEFSFAMINGITSTMDSGIDVERAKANYLSFAKWYERNKGLMKNFIEPVIGNIKNISLHPAGVVIIPDKINRLLPIRTQPDPHQKSVRVASTVWENSHTSREDLNEIGVMVLDILGVRTLSIVSDVMDLVEKLSGNKINLYELDLGDEKTLKKFNEGELIGVFQFSGGSASVITKSTLITEFNDLIVINALARPGALSAGADKIFAARKKSPKKVRYDHHSLKTVLNDSLGVLVFSEHILRTASEFAGMHPKEADNLRKIIKGKNLDAFKEYKKEFIAGAKKKWIKEKNINIIAENIWEKFSKAGSYLFPRGHASSYALLGFICQYLKVHHPLEFFTCFLTHSIQNKYAEIKAVAETKYGLKFNMPNINAPKAKFEASRGAIDWPITALKQVGAKAWEEIAGKAPFTSMSDFSARVEGRSCNKRIVENLVIAGAFSDFGDDKVRLIKEWGKKKAEVSKKKVEFYDSTHTAFLSEENMISAMSEVFGFESTYLEELYEEEISRYSKHLLTYEEFEKAGSDEQVVLFGRISRISEIVTKKGDKMAFLGLKRKDKEISITLFPESYNVFNKRNEILESKVNGKPIIMNSVVLLSGKKNVYNHKSSVVIDSPYGVTGQSKFARGSWIKAL